MVTTPVPAFISALPLAPWAPAGAVRNTESIPKHNQPRAFLIVLSTTIVLPPNRKLSTPTLLFVAGIRGRDHGGVSRGLKAMTDRGGSGTQAQGGDLFRVPDPSSTGCGPTPSGARRPRTTRHPSQLL